VQLGIVRASCVPLRYFCLELYINLTLALLCTEHANKCRSMESERCTDWQFCFDRTCFLREFSAAMRYPTHCEVPYVFLSRGQYFYCAHSCTSTAHTLVLLLRTLLYFYCAHSCTSSAHTLVLLLRILLYFYCAYSCTSTAHTLVFILRTLLYFYCAHPSLYNKEVPCLLWNPELHHCSDSICPLYPVPLRIFLFQKSHTVSNIVRTFSKVSHMPCQCRFVLYGRNSEECKATLCTRLSYSQTPLNLCYLLNT
jgi:hypothetical protein